METETKLTVSQKSALNYAMDILAELEGPEVDEAWALLKRIVKGA